MPSTMQSKSMAKVLKQAFADRGVQISHSTCLEIVAHQCGYSDWNTLRATQGQGKRLSFALFVEHGRENEAVKFYQAAFDAVVLQLYHVEGRLAAADLVIGDHLITVAGANPDRERQPDRGGPFFPKAPGAVNSMLKIETSDIERIASQALAAGATIRDQVQPTVEGAKIGSLFDPYGHVWALQQG